ncbi:hypothetical protein O181_034543 [Austropuccinia psidii MF-1]|uniref:Uncharacterized protein n=1 Tax=Austropuccinia psidii MF-1 TaxID=1389203 RepID=A0A9Q3H7G0_9BASI|nr:hypothetical protein [Austropuccinia psidii MF-1]
MKQISVIKHEGTTPERHLFLREKLKEAEFNNELTEEMKEKLSYLLHNYKSSFEADKEPLGAIMGNKVNITLNVDNLYLPLLRRPSYPAIPRARQAVEVNI